MMVNVIVIIFVAIITFILFMARVVIQQETISVIMLPCSCFSITMILSTMLP
jgi:hypothetical protein